MTRLAFVAVIAAFAMPAFAQDYGSMSCNDLWAERNAIYKDGGYCFKTARAIRYFGNAGCQYDNERDVPLSANQRARVNAIQGWERRYGCPR